MNVERKLQLHVVTLLLAAFIALAFAVGFVYALAISLAGFLVWRAYSQAKLMRWWKNESAMNRQMMEYIATRLNEGKESKCVWIRNLALPDLAEVSKNYQVELMARQMIIEKQSEDLVDGWSEWGSLRLEECVLCHESADLEENVGSASEPITMFHLMISRAALEINIAEHALFLLGVATPRQILRRRMASRQINAKKSDSDFDWAFKSERTAFALRLLSKELGEAG